MAPAVRIEGPICPVSAAEAVGGLAATFSGAVARRQILELGFEPSRIRNWLRSGRLHPTRYPGVYAWGRPDLPVEGQLAAGLLYAGSGSALDGLSALWWQKLLGHRPTLIHIAAPGRRSSRADLAIRHPLVIKRHMHGPLAVVDLARALLVASVELEHNSLRLVLARADFEDLLHLPSLQAACARGLKGSRKLRAAMDSHLPALAHCVNDFERDFVLLCEARDIPIPEPNVRMGRRVPDMLWRDRMLIVELDGKGAHSSQAQRIDDRAKQEWLESLGYTVIRFTWRQVYFQPGYVVDTLRPYFVGS